MFGGFLCSLCRYIAPNGTLNLFRGTITRTQSLQGPCRIYRGFAGIAYQALTGRQTWLSHETYATVMVDVGTAFRPRLAYCQPAHQTDTHMHGRIHEVLS